MSAPCALRSAPTCGKNATEKMRARWKRRRGLQDVQFTVRISNKHRLDGCNGGVVGGSV